MNDPNQLLTRAVRGELTPEEQQQWQQILVADSGLQQRFAEEQELERLLHALPDARLSSNFTALVMQTVERDSLIGARNARRARLPWLRFAFARVALGLTAVLVIGLSAVYQYQRAQQAEFAQKVGAFTEVAASVGSEQAAELWTDFEAIHRLSLPAESELDLELFAALQK